LLEAVGIMKEYRRREGRMRWKVIRVLDNLNLLFREGCVTSVIGPSGCGKSTLVNVLAGYEMADSGYVLYRGRRLDFRREKETLRRHIRIVFQNPYSSLNPFRTAGWHLDYTASALGLGHTEVKSTMELAGIQEERYRERMVDSLSGGERQRLAFAIALLAPADVLILDEPFSMLDSAGALGMLDLLKRLSTGRTIIYIDQNIARAAYVSAFTYLMEGGRVVMEGWREQLFSGERGKLAWQVIGRPVELGERIA